MKNTTLTEHLQNQLHKEPINEGISDWLKGLVSKDTKATPKQEAAAKKSMGLLGLFASKIEIFSSDDPVSAAFEAIMKDQQEEAERRMKDFQESKEGALVAKMKAKWGHKKNQLDLANKKKIAAYDQKKKEFERAINFWKNNKTSYTEEENNAYDEQLEDSYNSLGNLRISELDELKALHLKLAYDDEGNSRNLEDIKKYAATDEGKATYERFNELAKKNNKPMLDAVNGNGFKEVMEAVQVSSDQMEKAKAAQENADKELKDYGERAKAVDKIKEIKKELDNANTKVTDCEKELGELTSKYVSSEISNKLFDLDSDGKLKLKSDADIQTAIQSAMDGVIKAEDADEAKKESVKKALIGLGIPESVVSSLKVDDINDFNADKIAEHISGKLKEESGEELKESILNDATEKYEAAQSKVKSAKVVQSRWDEINKCIENGTPVNEMSAEAQEMLSDEQISNIDTYRSIPEDNRKDGTYDVNNPYGKEVKARLDKDKEACDEKVKKLNEINEARKAERKMRLKQLEKSNNIPTEVQEKIDKYMQGIDRGEVKKDGKVGYITKNEKGENEFIERPGIDASKEEKEKYEKGRDKALILNDDEKPPYNKVEFLGNGKYKIDGEETNDEELAIEAQSLISLYHQNKALADAKREEFINSKLNSMITSDGGFDKEKYDELSPEDKECVDAMMKDPDKYLGKLAEQDSKFANIKKKLDDEKFQMQYDEYEDDDSEDDDETKELRNSQDEEIDSDEDSGKDKEGNELVKGGDGKWYKKKEDGTADVEGGEQTSTKTKLKNPAKIWHKRKNKRTGKPTENYYDKEGNSISKKDFKNLVKNYNEKKKKQSQSNESLSNYLKRSII